MDSVDYMFSMEVQQIELPLIMVVICLSPEAEWRTTPWSIPKAL